MATIDTGRTQPLKPGWHRLSARDGTVAGMLVADGGHVVELVHIGGTEPPPRPRRRYVGTPAQLAARAAGLEAERIERLVCLAQGGPLL